MLRIQDTWMLEGQLLVLATVEGHQRAVQLIEADHRLVEITVTLLILLLSSLALFSFL